MPLRSMEQHEYGNFRLLTQSGARALLSAAAFCLPFLALDYANANDAATVTVQGPIQGQVAATTTFTPPPPHILKQAQGQG